MPPRKMTEKEFWESAVQRFWKGVDKGGPDDCWEWQKFTNPGGYGKIKIQGKSWSSHRVSWMIHRGDPGDKHVLHRCDNPPCCNPNHLFLGTHADNVQDMITKGRDEAILCPGESNHNSKLTEADVIEIRKRLANGERHKDIAASYGVSRTAISDINGRSWKHL